MWAVTLVLAALHQHGNEGSLRQERLAVTANGQLEDLPPSNSWLPGGGNQDTQELKYGETDPPVYISLTTTPERLHSDWFKQSLTNLMTLNYDYKVVLNIPRVQKSTGMVYLEDAKPAEAIKKVAHQRTEAELSEVPSYIYRWAAQDHRLKLHRCDDSGPLTKLVGSLDNAEIPQDALLVVVDDDQIYKPEVVRMLASAHKEHPDDIVTMCTTPVEGFKGFALTKMRAMPIAVMQRPASCFRVDDAFIQEASKKLKLSVYPVSYPGYKANKTDCPATAHGRKWCKWSSMCSVEIGEFATQPDWHTLNEDENDGTRVKLDKACRLDFAEAQRLAGFGDSVTSGPRDQPTQVMQHLPIGPPGQDPPGQDSPDDQQGEDAGVGTPEPS